MGYDDENTHGEMEDRTKADSCEEAEGRVNEAVVHRQITAQVHIQLEEANQETEDYTDIASIEEAHDHQVQQQDGTDRKEIYMKPRVAWADK